MSNVIYPNNTEALRFYWQFVTFSGETQVAAQVRWRKAGFSNLPNTLERLNGGNSDSNWSTPIQVDRFEDTNTWTLVGGQFVPPAASARRYSNVTYVMFPAGFFTEGVWLIQTRMITAAADGTTDGVWGSWSTHNVEINSYARMGEWSNSGTSQVTFPVFPVEGQYVWKVEVMSEAGVTAESADTNTFNVWQTDKFINDAGTTKAIPEFWNNGTTTGRVKRNT
jgi:hypothetical protein